MTGKSGYDANTFYNYKFTFSKKFHIWGVYVEAKVAEKAYTVTAVSSNDTYGTVSAGASSLDATETTTITATPATGYQVTNWAVSGTGASISPSGASNSNTTTLTMGTANATVTATFGLKSYTVTLNNQSATTPGTENVTTTYNSNTNLTSAITKPTKDGKVFAGYFTGTNGTGIQLIDPAGNWIASAGGDNTYMDGSKNWKYDNNLTLYACWMEYCPGMDMDAYVNENLSSGSTSQTFTILTTNKFLYSLTTGDGKTEFDNSTTNSYDGLKIKKSGNYVIFLVQANYSLSVKWGYVKSSKPKYSINGGAAQTFSTLSTGGDNSSSPGDIEISSQSYDQLVKIWSTDDGATVLKKVTITAPAGCSAYEFHYGTNGQDNWETECFEQVGETNEWKIEDFTIPSTTHFYVGYHGDGTNGWNSTWSSERAWTDWPTKSDNKWQGQIFLAPNDGALGSFAVGQATGAVGTLTIHSDYNDLNKYLSFTPNGYGITYGGTGHAFAETATSNMYETDVVTLPDVSTTYNIGLATATEGTYVKSIHSKATDEAISAMGVTEIDGGKKKIYLDAGVWRTDEGAGEKIAIWDFTTIAGSPRNCWGANDNSFMTYNSTLELYEGYVLGDATNIILVRIDKEAETPSWDKKWNQTDDITLSTLNNKFSITGWHIDDDDQKNSSYTVTSMHPTTGQKGKFRMWANSASTNWYVHWIPYYVLSYNANGGSGTTAQTERSSESSTTTVSTASNGFTAPTGYSFNGWNTLAGGGGDSYAAGDSYTLTADATLYAQWECTTPTFGTNLSTSTVNYALNASASALTVAATAGSGTVSYQWYSNDENNTTTPTILTGQTNASYTPSTTAAGTKYYYCVATNSSAGCSTTATSNITPVTVAKADISPSLSYTSTTLTVGGGNSSNPTVSGNTGNGGVTYSSSNTSVATVNETTGVVTAVAAGSATITATIAATTNYNGNTATATFTVNAAAPAAECITWEGTPSSWTGDATPWTMTVSTNLVLKTVGKKWDINSSTVNSDYAKVWVEDETEIKKTVIAIDKHDDATKYLQGSFADGSEIQSLTIGAANNNSTAGTNKKYVVLFSATEAFTSVLEYETGKYAQEITAPSFKDAYNASNLEKAITVPSGAKFFRIYRKVVKDYVIGGFTADKDYGDGATIRIFKIEACPEGSACTDPTIAWDNTPASGLVGGTMTASVTSNYPAGVTYSSSDATVASVNASTGVISYLKAGSATITATVVGDGTTYCDLTTDPSVSQLITVTAPATGIAISPATIDVQVGGTADLTATLTPAGAADATVNWTSEYSSIATVAIIGGNDKTARVTGVALRPSGEAFKIYAKTASLTANSWYATVRVYKGVTYDASTNSGTCATTSAKYYGDAALVLPAATRTGYTFNGWYTASSGGSKIGDAGDEYTPTANSTTLYAQFTENVTTYAITYELNSGTHGTTYSTTGTPGTAHELSAPTRSGYTFAGWSVSPVVSGAKWGTTSSPTTAIEDASTLAQNGTSSVYFKNLAAANGAVTITAHWTRDCETSGGGGSGTEYTPDRSISTKNKDTVMVSYTIPAACVPSGGNNHTIGGDSKFMTKIRTNLTRSVNAVSKSQCFYITVNSGYTITGINLYLTMNASGQTQNLTNIYVDNSTYSSPNTSITYASISNIEVTSISATSQIVLQFDDDNQVQIYAEISYTSDAGGGDEIPCYHVTYHANGAELGAVEDAARYVEGATVTVKPNGYTKTGADFLGWATSDSRADAGTVDYDPDDEEKNSFTMGTADVNLYAVWGTAAPRVYALTGSAYRCTSDAESTITLAGSETDVNYQLKKDGENDGAPVSGTGSALTWSKSAWGTYTVVATRSAVSSMMSGEVVLSDYPLVVTENLNGGTVAQDGAFTLSAKVSVHADNSASYTYQWFSNNAANYDTPLSLGSATAMAASTGTQQFDYNPSTASGGTTYYFCEFTSPCGTVVRTRVVSVTVTTSTTTLTWDRDGEGDDFEDLPQGGKHTITVTSNSGVAPSLEVAGTDVELTDVEQNAETATTTATLVLGASAADVVPTAEVSANDDYAEKSEDKEVIVKECSAGSETVLLSAYLSAYNAFTKDAGSGTATISNPGSDTHVTCSEKNYYKMVNGSTYYTFTLGGTEKFQAGDRIIFDVASSDQGNEKDFEIGLKASTSGSELHAVSTTLTTCEEVTFTIPVGSGLINGNTVIITRKSSENRVYGISIVRGGGSGSAADVASGIVWITDPDPGHGQGSKAITRSISNDPFTYAVRATTPSMGTITYASSVESVATVDANGRVTIVGAGTTTISAQQEAIGCYLASSTLSYSLTVESCTGEKEPVITYDGTVICPDDSKTLTATNYEDGATFQWYKDGAEIGGATDETYDATAAGTYTVVAHKDCYSESSNSVTLTKMSATVDVKTLADEFTIKSERPYNFRLFEIEDGATMTVQSRSGIDAENSVVTLSGNIISISGTAPTIASAGDATIDIRISRTGGCSSIYVDKIVTIHKIPATAKPTIAWIATKTTIKDKKEVAVKGVKDEVDADKSSDVDLYQELEKYYTVTARNCYWTASEAELVKEYSQYDLIVLTDYPNSQTAPSGNDKTKSYTNAIGLLKDHIPMLTFEAYVAQCPNWEIPSNPQNTSNTQNDITLLCNADEIFDTSGKFGAGSAISVSTVGSGQAMQGFLPADAPFVFIGSITDDGTTYIACCERQVNPAARMMIFGLNANTMNNLTSDGKEMVRGFINYLMISDAASIPDCSVIFNGGAGDGKWETVGNWEGGTLPGKYASVRIDKPCVVSGDYVAEAGYLKIHTSTNESAYPYTGKLTIASDGVMAIDGTITRVEDNRYTLHLPTRPEDLIIESDASGQGALIFDNDEGTTQARVEMYTKAFYDGEKDHWQYVAVPLASANRWSLGSWTYQFDNVSGEWDYYVDYFSPFQAIALAQDNTGTHVFEGTLASTQTQKIAMPAMNAIEGTSLIGNSWTAPIQIVNFEEEDFGGAKASVFIYETGYDPDGDPTSESGNSGERAAGKWYEIPVFGAATLVTSGSWAGMKVIPAMQAFEVKNESGVATTFTMDYDRLVRNAVNDKNAARRAPQRAMASVETPTLRITMSDGEIRNDVYLLSGERFSEGYDNGWDGEYVGGNNCSQLYALSPIGNLSMSAQPEMEGTILGFAAGTKPEFTITFHYVGEEELYLNDMEAHRSTLISGENEYTFTAESGERGNRFVIGEQLFGAPEIATGVTDLDAENLDVQKVIYNDKLYIIRGGKVFSADGQLVK